MNNFKEENLNKFENLNSNLIIEENDKEYYFQISESYMKGNLIYLLILIFIIILFNSKRSKKIQRINFYSK